MRDSRRNDRVDSEPWQKEEIQAICKNLVGYSGVINTERCPWASGRKSGGKADGVLDRGLMAVTNHKEKQSGNDKTHDQAKLDLKLPEEAIK